MELKEKVMEATIEQFNEKGLKFTMDDVAKHMGISKRTLYSVVEDKESLFLEAIEYGFAAIKESEQEIINDSNLDMIEKIKRIIIVLPNKYKTIDFRQLYELESKFPKIYKKVEDRLETDWEPTLKLLKQAMEEGKIKRILLPVFQGMVSGAIEYFISRNILIENQIGYTAALSEMVDILIEGILVGEER